MMDQASFDKKGEEGRKRLGHRVCVCVFESWRCDVFLNKGTCTCEVCVCEGSISILPSSALTGELYVPVVPHTVCECVFVCEERMIGQHVREVAFILHLPH